MVAHRETAFDLAKFVDKDVHVKLTGSRQGHIIIGFSSEA